MEQERSPLPCIALWVLSALGAALAACSDYDPAASIHSMETVSPSSTGAAGAGGCGADNGAIAGAGGSVAADDPCAALSAPGAPEARVVWVPGGDRSLNISSEVSFLWSFQYAVRLPEHDRNDYTLTHERCETPAGGLTSCSSGEIALPIAECSVSSAPKFGVDPSQYEVGRNLYELTLRLMRGCRVTSASALTIELTYAP